MCQYPLSGFILEITIYHIQFKAFEKWEYVLTKDSTAWGQTLAITNQRLLVL